ncbi:ABC transporter permease [Paenibacillus hamazuiensis]|uniref:ABC transporter permease n=1 Tax=Paenibacillus hamazuiensis TaxID=2936508 RepID=UPI00200D1E22|nr:ABC transporter permease [Paenibacillus hamazuiensis]
MILKSQRWNSLFLILPALIVFIVFFLGPMIYLTMLSFRPTVDSDGWTLNNYFHMFKDSFVLEVVLRTVKLSFVSAFLDIILAYPLALVILRSSPGWRAFYTMLILSPLLVSVVVRSFGWMILLAPGGFINNVLMHFGLISEPVKLLFNETSVVIGLTHIHLPHVIIALLTALYSMDPRLESASASLGARPWQTFWRVTFPLSMPGVLSGGLLAFSLSMSSFVLPNILGGPRYKVLAALAYEQTVGLFNWPFGATLSLLLLFISTGIVAFYQKMSKGQGKEAMV